MFIDEIDIPKGVEQMGYDAFEGISPAHHYIGTRFLLRRMYRRPWFPTLYHCTSCQQDICIKEGKSIFQRLRQVGHWQWISWKKIRSMIILAAWLVTLIRQIFYKPRTSVGPITRTMKTYEVEMITDLNEEVSVCIEAPSADKAKKVAIGMLEDGELDCQSQVCMEYSVTEA